MKFSTQDYIKEYNNELKRSKPRYDYTVREVNREMYDEWYHTKDGFFIQYLSYLKSKKDEFKDKLKEILE